MSKARVHKRPTTEQERIEDGQDMFEILMPDGCVSYVMNHYAYNAKQIAINGYKAKQNNEAQRKEKLQRVKNTLAEYMKRRKQSVLAKQDSLGFANLDKQSLWDNQEAWSKLQ